LVASVECWATPWLHICTGSGASYTISLLARLTLSAFGGVLGGDGRLPL
jgi:hypothetical protein